MEKSSKRVSILIVFALLFSLMAPGMSVRADNPILPILFEDNFEDGNAAGWNIAEGSAANLAVENVNGSLCYCGNKTGSTISVTGATYWSDYEVAADLSAADISAFPGLIFRYQSASQFYMALLNLQDKAVILYKRQGGYTVLQKVSYDLKPGIVYNIKVEAKQNVIKVFLNDTLVIQQTESTYTSGPVGFRAYSNANNVRNCIDNVRVRDLTGVPDDPLRSIVELVTVETSTVVGNSIVLPAHVVAKYDQGSDSLVDVAWDSIDPGLFDDAGVFTVEGVVSGTTLKAQAVINVVGPPSHEAPAGPAIEPLNAVPVPAEGDLYVATDGNDNWSGLYNAPYADGSDGPFRTIQKAIDAVKAAKAQNPGKTYRIFVREGTYLLADSLTLDYSGVDLVSYPGEKPVISGGRAITAPWVHVSGDMWSTTIQEAANEGWYFRQLFVDGERAIRARYPNQNQYLTAKTIASDFLELVTNEDIPDSFSSVEGAELNSIAVWHYNRQKIASIDGAANKISSVNHIGVEASSFKIRAGDMLFLENALEFVDQPGEWYLDKETGVLTYHAAAGEDPNTQTFIAPKLTTLLEVQGEKADPVSHVNLYGLTFQYTEWSLPDIDRKGIQAGFWGRLRDEQVYAPPAAVQFEYVENSRIQQSTFANLGEGAVALEQGTRNNLIHLNRFYDVGANVIQIGRRDSYIGAGHPLHLDWPDPADSPKGNIISYNDIRDSAVTDAGSVAIWIGYANYTHVHHNRIFNMPYTAISIGWRWGAGLTSSHHNITEWNDIEKVMWLVGDGGGIYTVGEQPGSKILNNYILDSQGTYLSNGVYLDEGSNYVETAYNYTKDISSLHIATNRILDKNQIHDNYENMTPVNMELYGPGAIESIPPALQALMMDATSYRLKVGDTQSITASAVYSNNTVQDVTGDVYLQSSDETIALIASDGRISAIGTGTAQITAKYEGKEITVSVNIVGDDNEVVPSTTLAANRMAAAPGETVEFKLGLSQVNQTVALDTYLAYDPAVWEYVSVAIDRDNAQVIYDEDDPVSGEVHLIGFAEGEAHVITGDEAFLKVTLRAKASAADGSTPVSTRRSVVANGQGVRTTLADSTIHVTIEAQPTTPIDKSALYGLIATAEQEGAAATEAPNGVDVGYFFVGSLATQLPLLQTAIGSAETVAGQAGATQLQVDEAYNALQQALTVFRSYKITQQSGNLDGDEGFTIGDLAMVAYHYGKTEASPDWATAKVADINGDGVINLADLVFIARRMIG